jgi:hypothetical protein
MNSWRVSKILIDLVLEDWQRPSRLVGDRGTQRCVRPRRAGFRSGRLGLDRHLASLLGAGSCRRPSRRRPVELISPRRKIAVLGLNFQQTPLFYWANQGAVANHVEVHVPLARLCRGNTLAQGSLAQRREAWPSLGMHGSQQKIRILAVR